MKKQRFTLHLMPTIAFITLFSGLLSLGFWQLNRAEYKKQQHQQMQSQTARNPITQSQLNHIETKQLEYRQVTLHGHYDNQHQFLLDNRTHKRRVGYEVLTPLILDPGKQIILVNRGWIPSTGNRQQLPKLASINGQQTIRGMIRLPPKKTFTLNQKRPKKRWPLVIQTINFRKIQQEYAQAVYPFVILLSPKNSHGFVRTWAQSRMSANKHLGYAFQWFALALTLAIIYVALSIRRGTSNASTKES